MEENKKTNENNSNFLKTGVDELNENMSKLFSTDKKSATSPEKVDASLSDFEDQALQNFKLQKEDEIVESGS